MEKPKRWTRVRVYLDTGEYIEHQLSIDTITSNILAQIDIIAKKKNFACYRGIILRKGQLKELL